MNGVDAKQQKTKSNGGLVGKMTAIFNSSRSRRNSRDDGSTNSSCGNNKNEHIPLKDSMSRSFNEKFNSCFQTDSNGEFNNRNIKNGDSTLSNSTSLLNPSLYDYDRPTSVSEFLARHSALITKSLEIAVELPETSLTLTNGALTDDDTSFSSALSNSIISTASNNLVHSKPPLAPNLAKSKVELPQSSCSPNFQPNNKLSNGFHETEFIKFTHDANNNSALLVLKDGKNNSSVKTLTLPNKSSSTLDNNLAKKSFLQNETGIIKFYIF